MALPVVHYPQVEYMVDGFTPSIGASPVVAEVRSPFRGRLTKVGLVTGGAITTSNASIVVAINGTTVTGATFNVTFAGAAAGQNFTAVPSGSLASSATAANGFVNEDDVISFTPSNASGASIGATCYAMIKKN